MTLSNILATVRILNGVEMITAAMTKDLEKIRCSSQEKENSYERKNISYKPHKLYESKRRNMIRR